MIKASQLTWTICTLLSSVWKNHSHLLSILSWTSPKSDHAIQFSGWALMRFLTNLWHLGCVDRWWVGIKPCPHHPWEWRGLVGKVISTLRPRQNGRHFADDTFNCIFVNENVRISINFSLKFVPKGPINNIPALVQIMAWRRPGDKPLSEPVMVSVLTHICVTRPQWVNLDCHCHQTLHVNLIVC